MFTLGRIFTLFIVRECLTIQKNIQLALWTPLYLKQAVIDLLVLLIGLHTDAGMLTIAQVTQICLENLSLHCKPLMPPGATGVNYTRIFFFNIAFLHHLTPDLFRPDLHLTACRVIVFGLINLFHTQIGCKFGHLLLPLSLQFPFKMSNFFCCLQGNLSWF